MKLSLAIVLIVAASAGAFLLGALREQAAPTHISAANTALTPLLSKPAAAAQQQAAETGWRALLLHR